MLDRPEVRGRTCRTNTLLSFAFKCKLSRSCCLHSKALTRWRNNLQLQLQWDSGVSRAGSKRYIQYRQCGVSLWPLRLCKAGSASGTSSPSLCCSGHSPYCI